MHNRTKYIDISHHFIIQEKATENTRNAACHTVTSCFSSRKSLQRNTTNYLANNSLDLSQFFLHIPATPLFSYFHSSLGGRSALDLTR